MGNENLCAAKSKVELMQPSKRSSVFNLSYS